MAGHGGSDGEGEVRGSPEERFWAKVDKTDGCWLWTGSTIKGYGELQRGRRGEGKVLAHRFSWELANGPIPPSRELDHRVTCPKRCVRPSHLRMVPHKQNGENRDGAQRNSTSGFRGVSFHRQTKKWRAHATHHGKSIHGGLFSTAEKANEAAIALRRRLFTHSDMDVANRNTTSPKGETK